MDDSEDENGEVVVREFADWKPNPEQQYAQPNWSGSYRKV